MIRFECACGKRLKVEDSVAGRTVQCPHCGVTTRAPEAEPEPPDGPQALAAALRDVIGSSPDDIPVAEVVGEPPAGRRPGTPPSPEAAEAIKGLDALARAAASAPASKPSPRPTRRSPRSRKTPTPSDGSAIPNGRLPPAAGDTRHAAIIGAVAAVALVIIFVIVAAFIGGGGTPDDDSATPAPAAETAVETRSPRRFTGHQPGEMFRSVPFADETEAADAEKGKNQQP